MKAEEYVKLLYEGCMGSEKDAGFSKAVQYLLAEFSEDYDIRRKNAATITHIFIKEVLKIPDVEEEAGFIGEGLEKKTDFSKVRELKDLYDCRICVPHIEQMYVRNIMDAFITEPVKMFGGEEVFTNEEAADIVAKINKQFAGPSVRKSIYLSEE